MAYFGLVYEGRLELQELRTLARKYGAYPLALHLNNDGVTILNLRTPTKNGRGNPKVWTKDEIRTALSEFDNLMIKAYPARQRWILISPDARHLIPSGLEIAVHEMEKERKKAIDPKGLTPYELAQRVLGIEK